MLKIIIRHILAVTFASLIPMVANANFRYSGSDTLEPVIAAAQFSFLRANPSYKMSISGAGSAAGIRDLCSGKAALVGSSRPISASESSTCAAAGVNFVDLPVASDAIAIVVSTKNTWLKSLTFGELSTLYSPASVGKVTTWKQLRSTFPDTPIRAAGVDVKHGTFDFFSKSLGLNGFIRSDYKDFKDHTSTVRYVGADVNAVGFISAAEARTLEGQIQVIGIDFGKGNAFPSAEDLAANKYDKLNRTVYLYINTSMLVKGEPNDVAFVKHLLKDMESFVKLVNLTPLPSLKYQENVRRLPF